LVPGDKGIMFLNDGPVAWSSKKQPATALLTTEAEYIAVCQGGKTAVWLGYLMEDLLGRDVGKDVEMYQCIVIMTEQ